MYESRVCFLFTIFVACLQQLGHCRPQAFHPTDYYSTPNYYAGYGNQPFAGSFNSVPPPVTPNISVPETNQTLSPPSPYVPAVSSYFVPPTAPSQQHSFPTPHSYPHPAPIYPSVVNPHSVNHMPFNSSPYTGSMASNPGHQLHPSASFLSDHGSQQASSPTASHALHQTHAVNPFHLGFQQPYPSPQPQVSQHVPPYAPQLSYPQPPPANGFAHFPAYASQPIGPYPPHSPGYGYNLPPTAPFPHHDPYAAYRYSHSESSVSTTTKKATPTTPRPKTSTTTTPKPLEFELSLEDFFYLSQLHQLFNKSADKQTVDFSSLTRSSKRPGDEKDESPVFYGGVLDLDELSKIDNMKDLMEMFKKVGTKTHVSRTDVESGASDNPEAGEGLEADPEAGSNRRKGSHDATRSGTALRNKKQGGKKKKRRKESDRADHGDEEADEQEEPGDEDEETEEDETVGIGSTPSSSQRKRQRTTPTSTTSTTTVPPPLPVYNPYAYSVPYNYHQMQQQYWQQLQAMSGQLPSLGRPAEKEASKFPDEEPLASPNENRNVINVNIADPRKVGENVKNEASHNQELSGASSVMQSPLRRGSFNSMANSLAKKALSSVFYRIFPTMKHLNVKGVAARGCRDVQSIGSLDSIIMPLGLAVTLHPLLLPLVPFLLLALGSIKAIESATCFVSEYFS